MINLVASFSLTVHWTAFVALHDKINEVTRILLIIYLFISIP